MYGPKMDPIPFIIASYAISGLLIFGYAAWIVFQRKKTVQYLAALNVLRTDATKKGS